MLILMNNHFVPFPFTVYHFHVPLLHKFDKIVPLCSKILEGPFNMLRLIWLRITNEELCALYDAF